MASLREAEKRWIVEQLACFDTPQEVADAFSREFSGRSVTRQQVANYDASKPWARTGMSKALVKLFDEARESFRTETKNIPIANQAYRLRRMQRIVERTKSPDMELRVIEQAAKEDGGVYTNRQKVEHSGRVDSVSLRVSAEEVAQAKGPAELIELYRTAFDDRG